MKKLIIALMAVCIATTGCSSLNTNIDKSSLNQCLLEMGQKALLNGTLTKDTLVSTAQEIASACAQKLLLGTPTTENVTSAQNILEKLIK